MVKVVNSQTAIINRGEGGVATGETYAVFEAGEVLIDPQSGESLGSMETEVGLGKITQVKPKFAFLKMATGTLSEGTTYIVRKTDKKAPMATGKANTREKAAANQLKQPDRGNVFLSN